MNTLEHVNYTVTDVERTASMLQDIFSWQICWAGPSMADGNTLHIGGNSRYLALYSRSDIPVRDIEQHVGVLVDDLDEIEQRVRQAGYTPFNFGEYEPGRRFYFIVNDQIEYEVVSYA